MRTSKGERRPAKPKTKTNKLSVEELEARLAPAAATDKKVPTPPPYAPGTLYGLVKRENLDY